jgi:tyrosyl-tRNA synthetase
MELVRRITGAEVHGITSPLITTAAGTKFGKTEAGAVWLDASLTSPYKFYQFWVNVDDRDAGLYLRYFTLRTREAIETLDAAMASRPERREAQYAVARDVTGRVHGAAALAAAEEVSQLLFGGGDPKALSAAALTALSQEIPFFRLVKGDPVDTQDIIDTVSIGDDALFKSKGDARRMIQQGGVYLNGRRLGPEREPLAADDLLAGRYVLVRKGARANVLVEVVAT